MTIKLLNEHNLKFLSLKGDCTGCLSLHLSKCHIVAAQSYNRTSHYKYMYLSKMAFLHIINLPIKRVYVHTQGAEVTGQLRVNDRVRHLRRCTLEDQSLALKRKHRVHKYVNTAAICVSVMNSFILT